MSGTPEELRAAAMQINSALSMAAEIAISVSGVELDQPRSTEEPTEDDFPRIDALWDALREATRLIGRPTVMTLEPWKVMARVAEELPSVLYFTRTAAADWVYDNHALLDDARLTLLGLYAMAQLESEEPAERAAVILTRRQQKVLDILSELGPGEGLTAKEIAAKMGDGTSEAAIRNRTISELTRAGVVINNRAGAGYYLG